MLPASDVRLLNGYDMRYMPGYQLRLARNEIFARHGYRFNSEDLQQFFGRRLWYTPVDRTVSLSDIEQANVELIKRIEDGALDPAQQVVRAPDGVSLPPWTAWQADMVFANGSALAAIVDGVRARTVDLDTGHTVVVRADMEDMLVYDFGRDTGIVAWWGLFPPLVLEPYVQALGIVPRPVGREMLFGESVMRVGLDWESEDGFYSLSGEAWLTDDGIFLRVDVGGVFAECCDGDTGVPWSLRYHLENLDRGRTDPSLLEPPPFHEWGFAG